MKNVSFILFFILFTFSGIFGQQVIPAYNPKLKRSSVQTVITRHVKQINDSTVSTTIDTASIMENLPDDHVFIYGVGNMDALRLENLSAVGSAIIGLRPTENYWFLLSFNFDGFLAKKQSADSVPLSQIFFPDIGTSAINLSTEARFFDPYYSPDKKSEFSFLFCEDASIQNRNIEKDSLTYNINITNFNAGFKFRWAYSGRNDHRMVLTSGFLYNSTSITRHTENSFNALFNDYVSPGELPIRPNFMGLSSILSLQIDNTIFYYRSFTPFKDKSSFSFTVGVKATLKCASF